MKRSIALVSIILVFTLALTVWAQDPDGPNSIASLKRKLAEVEVKETQLRMGLEELDEELKPECIERALAGIGSTHPEEMREHRRRLLMIERDGLQAQLDLLQEDRARIEAAIAAAEAAAYLKYADASPTPAPVQ